MIAGMVPLALGIGEGAEQSAPMGRALIGGLTVAALATLLILPAIFTLVMGSSKVSSASLHPDDVDSAYYAPEPVGAQRDHGKTAHHDSMQVAEIHLHPPAGSTATMAP